MLLVSWPLSILLIAAGDGMPMCCGAKPSSPACSRACLSAVLGPTPYLLSAAPSASTFLSLEGKGVRARHQAWQATLPSAGAAP